jgi:universal stress protein F
MYKNILVPISFDEGRDPDQAIEIAKFLAEEGTKITLLHVMEKVPGYAQTYMPEGYIENSLAACKSEMATMAETIKGGQSAVVTGHSGTTILDFAQEAESDLIIIASHQPKMADYFLGSTAHHVVRHARCSVHVMR